MSPGEELKRRVVLRRMRDCHERAVRRADELQHAFIDAPQGSEWDTDEGFERYLASRDRLLDGVAMIAADIASLEAGGDVETLHWRIRQAHCRFGGCDRPRRRHMPRRLLERYPLTQPQDVCQSCGYESRDGGPLELDHIAELVFGGADAPYNLIRVCGRCHRQKPIWPDEPPALARILALEWYGVTGAVAAA